MRCEMARERMLEVDPAELVGGGTGELAGHLAACPECAGVAAALVRELAALEDAVEAWAAAGDARAAADAVLAGSRERPPVAGPLRRRAWRVWVPLAAAAALAAVLLMSREPGVERTGTAVQAAPAPRVAVTPPPDRGAAIMETPNPKITIVWLYEKEES